MSRLCDLKDRDRVILEELKKGKIIKAIAKELNLSPS